jgi:hypothetical protein
MQYRKTHEEVTVRTQEESGSETGKRGEQGRKQEQRRLDASGERPGAETA